MRVVILGDIHLYDLNARPWQLLGKRLLGQTNLWFHRRKRFNPRLLEPVVEQALSLNPDWFLLTGDLTTTALETELRQARQMLEPLLATGRTVVIPGNHDRYTFTATRRRRFEAHFSSASPQRYPHVMDLSSAWRLIAINSALPRALSSRGHLDARQLDGLRDLLRETPAKQGVIILCHYPPALPEDQPYRASHALAQHLQLREILSAARRPMVFLHGHVHRPWHWLLTPQVRIVNAGSPCMTSARYPMGQGFWQADLPDILEPGVSSIQWLHHVPMPACDGLTNSDPASRCTKLQWTQDFSVNDLL
jgi:3',5'-cyclic AMP phosphodiesterase CpdA